jgi:hypothetical protein
MANRPGRSGRGFMAALSVLLSAGVAVLVNIWTSGWGWPVGVGLAVLVVCQGSLEWLRSSQDHAPGSAARTPTWRVLQKVGHMAGGTATGIRSPSPGSRAEVRQDYGTVENGNIVGIDGDPSRDISGGAAEPPARS